MGQGAEKDSEDAVYVIVVRFVRDHFVLQAQNLAFRAKDVPPQGCLVDLIYTTKLSARTGGVVSSHSSFRSRSQLKG